MGTLCTHYPPHAPICISSSLQMRKNNSEKVSNLLKDAQQITELGFTSRPPWLPVEVLFLGKGKTKATLHSYPL